MEDRGRPVEQLIDDIWLEHREKIDALDWVDFSHISKSKVWEQLALLIVISRDKINATCKKH